MEEGMRSQCWEYQCPCHAALRRLLAKILDTNLPAGAVADIDEIVLDAELVINGWKAADSEPS